MFCHLCVCSDFQGVPEVQLRKCSGMSSINTTQSNPPWSGWPDPTRLSHVFDTDSIFLFIFGKADALYTDKQISIYMFF